MDLHQRQKLVYLLTLSKKLYGFICVLTNSKPQTGHVTWSRKKLSLWAIVDSLDLTEELMWKSGVFLSTLATAGNNFIVMRKSKICLIVISQKNLQEFAGKRLDRRLKKMLFNQPKKKSHARKCLCLPDSMMLLSNQKNLVSILWTGTTILSQKSHFSLVVYNDYAE